MSNAGTKAVKELLGTQDVTFFHDIADVARKAMKEDVRKAMNVFYNK